MVKIFQRISHTTKNKVVCTTLNSCGFHDKTFLHKILATISSFSLEISIWTPCFQLWCKSCCVMCRIGLAVPSRLHAECSHCQQCVRVTTALCVHSYEAFVWVDCGNRLSSVNQLPVMFVHPPSLPLTSSTRPSPDRIT